MNDDMRTECIGAKCPDLGGTLTILELLSLSRPTRQLINDLSRPPTRAETKTWQVLTQQTKSASYHVIKQITSSKFTMWLVVGGVSCISCLPWLNLKAWRSWYGYRKSALKVFPSHS